MIKITLPSRKNSQDLCDKVLLKNRDLLGYSLGTTKKSPKDESPLREYYLVTVYTPPNNTLKDKDSR